MRRSRSDPAVELRQLRRVAREHQQALSGRALSQRRLDSRVPLEQLHEVQTTLGTVQQRTACLLYTSDAADE